MCGSYPTISTIYFPTLFPSSSTQSVIKEQLGLAIMLYFLVLWEKYLHFWNLMKPWKFDCMWNLFFPDEGATGDVLFRATFHIIHSVWGTVVNLYFPSNLLSEYILIIFFFSESNWKAPSIPPLPFLIDSMFSPSLSWFLPTLQLVITSSARIILLFTQAITCCVLQFVALGTEVLLNFKFHNLWLLTQNAHLESKVWPICGNLDVVSFQHALVIQFSLTHHKYLCQL